MQIKWKKLLFRLVGLNLLSQEASKWLNQFKEYLKVRTKYLLLRVSLGILIFSLFKVAFIFTLIALSLYLNERFYSTYQGFLLVAGGCVGCIMLLLLITKVAFTSKKDIENDRT
jgi:hypothetical protein